MVFQSIPVAVVCFLPGGVLLSDQLSADCVSDGAGH